MRCPPNLSLRYSGIVNTWEDMYTGTNHQPNIRMKNTETWRDILLICGTTFKHHIFLVIMKIIYY